MAWGSRPTANVLATLQLHSFRLQYGANPAFMAGVLYQQVLSPCGDAADTIRSGFTARLPFTISAHATASPVLLLVGPDAFHSCQPSHWWCGAAVHCSQHAATEWLAGSFSVA